MDFDGGTLGTSLGIAEKRGVIRAGGGLKVLPFIDVGVVDVEIKEVGRRHPNEESLFSSEVENDDNLLAVGVDLRISVD